MNKESFRKSRKGNLKINIIINNIWFPFTKNNEWVLYLQFDFFRENLLDKIHIDTLLMKKVIYSNIKSSDALESFFECITSCSINSEGVASTTACYVKHLESKNIDYPLKFI